MDYTVIGVDYFAIAHELFGDGLFNGFQPSLHKRNRGDALSVELQKVSRRNETYPTSGSSPHTWAAHVDVTISVLCLYL